MTIDNVEQPLRIAPFPARYTIHIPPDTRGRHSRWRWFVSTKHPLVRHATGGGWADTQDEAVVAAETFVDSQNSYLRKVLIYDYPDGGDAI
jgi:hypothetical protein